MNQGSDYRRREDNYRFGKEWKDTLESEKQTEIDVFIYSPGASGMQPRDPCRPWRGTLASGHKPR